MARARKHNKTPKGRYAFLLRKGTDLSREDYYALLEMPCHYCERPLNGTGTGLDQIKPSEGYTYLNVVPCCMVCNVIKRDWFTYEEMLVLGQAVKKVFQNRQPQSIARFACGLQLEGEDE